MTSLNEPSGAPRSGPATSSRAGATHTSAFATLPPLRDRVRALARHYGLGVQLRARLVLSVAKVARGTLAAGHAVTLTAVEEPARAPRQPVPETEAEAGGESGDPCGGLLSVCLRPEPPHPVAADDLPLVADACGDGSVVWRLALPGAPPAPAAFTEHPPRHDGAGSDAGDDAGDLEEELLAVIAHTDALESEHRKLKHELAETNSGVLAMYVQLEERDEALRTAHGKTLRELEDALRPPPIEVTGIETAVHYAPAGTDAPTGGDLYDWFTLPDGRLHITVVDALGHGVTSTRSALNVTHAVRTLALEGHPLQSIVGRTDEVLLPFDPELMATVLLARIDPATGEMQLANGSHPPALLLRSTGESEYLEVRGRGIGFPMAGSEAVLRRTLGEGDLLVLYTDGLTESRRDPKEGEKRLVEAARAHADRPIAEVPGALAADMHTVILHADDTLALSVRRTG